MSSDRPPPDRAGVSSPDDITRALEATFHETVMQHAARSLTKPEDWAEASALLNRLKDDEAQLQERYEADYDARVDAARAELFDKTTQLTLDLPGPHGRSGKTDGSIETAAHLKVRQDHENALQTLRTRFQDDLFDLQETARARDLRPDRDKGKARDAFDDVADRRKTPDRRAPKRGR